MKIDGVPEGYELVRIGKPQPGDSIIQTTGDLYTFFGTSEAIYPIVRRLRAPLKLREGAWYERRDGNIVGPIAYRNTHQYTYCVGSHSYMANGRVTKFGERAVDLIREVPPPAPKYRPYANADEFIHDRDKWIKSKREDSHGERLRVTVYNDSHVFFNSEVGESYRQLLDEFVFEDGEPCGVRVP